jgi:predicted DNA-binding protein (UPF0251 family)
MSRPCCPRRIGFAPDATYFKPAGVPVCHLEQVTLTLDEVEALRLADLQGLYQEQAAKQMKISRPTFARIIEEARRKVAEALIHGKALRLEGGAVIVRKGHFNVRGKDGIGSQGTHQGRRRGSCGCGRRRSACGRGRASQRTTATTMTDKSASADNKKGK